MMYANCLDSVDPLNQLKRRHYYIHDALYNCRALINEVGLIGERSDYDVYGRPETWIIADIDGNGTVDDIALLIASFGKSECDADYNWRCDFDNSSNVNGDDSIIRNKFSNRSVPAGYNSYFRNPYYFTGRRVDVLDAGSLKLQYSRNRYYDYNTGRWITKDPLGITPNPQKPNLFSIFDQYKNGLSLYEYMGSRPVINVDPYGLWGIDTHYARTTGWALEENKMLPWAAESVGYWDNYVDTRYSPITFDHTILGWHFDTEGITEPDPVWGASDSRYLHAEAEYCEAIYWCGAAKGQDIDTKRLFIRFAIEHLGTALHPVQDFVAHGSWKPWPTVWHPSPIHPSGTDKWGTDFTVDPKYGIDDGILRDWDYFGGWPKKPLFDSYFMSGEKRSKRTKDLTLHYLDRFKDESNGTPCACMVYSVNGRY